MFAAFWNAIVSTYAFFSAIPFISFFIIWIIAYAVYREKKKSTHMAMDITTFLLLGAVAAMFDRFTPEWLGGLWIILFVILLLFVFFGYMQIRIRGMIDWQKLVRAVWRISFVMLAICYIVLFVIISIINFVTG